jgi:hypothetical protein
MSNGVSGLAKYIGDTFKTMKNNDSAPCRGKISGSTILINGVYYPYTVASDAACADGDYAWCFLNESKTLVVVIGA